MNQEKIIRSEASEFFEFYVRGDNAIEQFHEVKERLSDFYTPEFKAVFLDEIETQIKNNLQKHRNEKHDGEATPDCPYEVDAEKLIFYIEQELGTLPIVAHKTPIENPKFERKKVFVSYSHKDKEHLADLKRHFKPFFKEIDFWDDSKILPGQNWKDEIIKALNETKVAILLVSTDFLGSDFISTEEVPPLLKAAKEDGASILIVVLKPCLFEEFPDLNQFQTLNPPSNPVIKMKYEEKEDLWVNLVRQTKRILNE